MHRVSGTMTLTSGTSEQTVFTYSPGTLSAKIWGIWFDFSNLTQGCTVRTKFAIDGTNFRTVDNLGWQTIDSDGVLIDGRFVVNDDFRVTIQSTVAEGASREIPYEYFYQPSSFTSVTDTHSHNSNTAEQTVLTLDPASGAYYANWGLWLDFANLTQTTTMKLYYMVDGNTLRQFASNVWYGGQDSGVLIDGQFVYMSDLRITLTSGTAEGSVKSVPYLFFYETTGSTDNPFFVSSSVVKS